MDMKNNNAKAIDIRNKGGLGRLRVTEGELQTIEKIEQDKKTAEEEQNKPHILSLAAYIRRSFDAAERAKTSNNIEDRFLECARRRKGEYEPDKLSDIRSTGGSEIYMQLTSVKCRALESWIRDIILPPGDKPWSICPTPVPDLPESKELEIAELVKEEVVQLMMINGVESVTNEKISQRMQEIKDQVLQEKKKQAKKDANRLEVIINDQLTEGNYYEALGEFITDLSTFPTAFIKGPIIKQKKKLVWKEDQNGDWVPQVESKLIREYQRVSGLDIYPSPGARNIQDGSLCERARLRPSDLEAMRGVPGFKENAINAVLDEHTTGGLRKWLTIDQERADLEDRPNEDDDPNPLIDCIIFWGQVKGSMLLDWGMPDKKIDNASKYYQITAWLIGNYVIMARLNPHPLGRRHYYAASFESVNDNIWGKAPPELFADCQDMCNAVARAISNNLGIASGPMVEFFKNRLSPGFTFDQIYPWMTVPTEDDGMGANNPAVRFYQPDDRTQFLLPIFEFFFQQASEQSGIPAYIYGNQDVGGAGKTASGLSMLMNAANKALKGVIAHIDKGVITKSIREHWTHVMLYDDDIEKIGDINIVARASEHLIIEEQLQIRRTEMLQATNNPWDMKIIGDKGRAKMLRETFDSMKMDSDEIVPTKEEMEAVEQMIQQAQAEAAGQMGIPPERMEGAEGAPGQPPGPVVTDQAGNEMGKPPGATMQPVNRA